MHQVTAAVVVVVVVVVVIAVVVVVGVLVAGLALVTCTMRLLHPGPGILRWAQGFLATDWGEILDALALGDTNRLDHHDF